MTKRRASIRGKGAEILFGEPGVVEVEPLSEDPSTEEVEAAEEQPETQPAAAPEEEPAPPSEREEESEPVAEAVEDMSEFEEALRAEALDGAPPPPDEPAPPATLEVEPPPTPEMEVAFIEEAFAAEIPPEPVAETPPPTLEVTMPERVREEELSMHEPPPPEVSDMSAGVLPPRQDPGIVAMHMEPMPLAMDIQEPEEEIKPLELPERELSEEEKQAILAWLGEDWIQELATEIDEAYEEVRHKVGENKAVATEAFNTLLKARDIVVRKEAAKLAQAEYYVETVRAQMKRVSESESSAKKYQWRILGWGFAWGAAFLALLILMGQTWFQEILAPAGTTTALLEIDVFVPAMLWGGIGGAVAVLYSLFKHVGARDFDSQFLVSYVGKPFLGLITGAVVYMVFNLVIRALGIFPAGIATGEGEITPTIAPGVVYLVAWAAGFKEDRILDLVDRVMKQIFVGSEEEEEEPAPSPAPEA